MKALGLSNLVLCHSSIYFYWFCYLCRRCKGGLPLKLPSVLGLSSPLERSLSTLSSPSSIRPWTARLRHPHSIPKPRLSHLHLPSRLHLSSLVTSPPVKHLNGLAPTVQHCIFGLSLILRSVRNNYLDYDVQSTGCSIRVALSSF